MAMKKIPTVEQSLLCASIYIINFKRVIEELVYNSLDAAASSIAIRVCIPENYIQVLDNGNGIIGDNFSLLGQKYATSKYINISTLKSAPDKYGYRGLCLANIVDVSQNVQISSRCQNSTDTWLKIFYNGKNKEICKTISRPSKGTTVEIKGFLYNLNIQRKSIDPHSELLNIKTALKQLSLVHCNVSISLRDDSRNVIILQIHKNRTIHNTLQSVLQINEKDFQELQVEKNEYKVKAFVGKDTEESSNYYQWIFINGKFIDYSILHRKLNEHFSKFLSSRNIRVKNKDLCRDENNYFNYNVPFYFLFITCPNYDFDMTYNSEKSLVEFKDWKEVNKLIEKLVQFCSAGLVFKKKELSKIESDKKKSDTRTEIKEIIEKILNNKNKQTRMTQLQNGVKGKILKRNRRKKKDLSMQKLLDNRTETKDPCQSRDFSKSPNEKKSMEQINQQPNILQRLKNSQMMTNNLTNEVLNLQATKINKMKKLILKKLKKNINCKDHLIKKCEIPKETIKSSKYKGQAKFLENNICKQYSYLKNSYGSLNDETLYQSLTKNTGNLSLNKKAKILLNEGNEIKIDNFNNQNVKTSYDLIKAVITSQYNMIEKKTTLITHSRQSYERKSNYTYNETFTPIVTYNSHNLNFESVQRMGCFISETSRSNFFLRKQELPPTLKENNSRQAMLPVTKSKNKITKPNILNKYQELQDFSYDTIEMTDSHNLSYCRRDTLHTTNNFYNFPEEDNHTKSHNFGNTYTFEDFKKRSHNNDNTLNKRSSLQTFNTSSSFHNSKEFEPSGKWVSVDKEFNNSEIEKNNYFVPETESDNSEMMPNIIEPIHCCEAVLSSENNDLKDFEYEFENSFVHKRDTVIISNYNFVTKENSYIEGNLNNNNDLRESTNNFERNHNLHVNHSINRTNNINKCKEILEYEIDMHMRNISIHKNLSQEIETLINNKIDCDPNYNFQLKSRHKFIPKGMSPIANSVRQYEIQNAHRFISGEIYYKDTIYENFLNDVLLYTEIFEPEVQNVEKPFSKHIEKVNSEMQKQNADLIFDSGSLMEAKILGQVDRKFIASILNGRSAQTAKPSEFLVLFDQHAVDERIRLESNLSDYLQDSNWKSIDIDPVSMVLNKDDYVYFVNHRDKLASFGLQWTFTSEYEILLNGIPKAILGKNPRQVELVMKAVKKLILEQIKAIKSLRGNVSLYPKSIMELVFSEACRYAIKFGDKLSKSECTKMINLLSYCKTPFQCAHGRPVIAVLMELKDSSRLYKVNLTTVKKFKNML